MIYLADHQLSSMLVFGALNCIIEILSLIQNKNPMTTYVSNFKRKALDIKSVYEITTAVTFMMPFQENLY